MSNYSEVNLILPTLEILNNNVDEGYSTTILISELRKKLKPNGEDLEFLKNRNDDKFSQKVRNLVSHKTLEKYSYAFQKGGKFFITKKGKSFLQDSTKINLDKNYDIGFFNLIKQEINKIKDNYELNNFSSAFNIYVLNKFFSDYSYEIIENISDGNFCKEKIMIDNNKSGGDDYGIDMFLIDNSSKDRKIICKLFNLKSTKDFKIATNKTFSGGEIHNINSFLSRLKSNDDTLLGENITDNLKGMIEDIISYNNDGFIVKYEIYFISNYYNGFCKKDLQIIDNTFKYEEPKIYTIIDIINLLDDYNKIDAKIRVNSDDFIELENPIRSLIVKIDADQLLRIVNSEAGLRLDAGTIHLEGIKENNIEDNIFEENVRIHLNERENNLINNNIIETAINNKDKFFYFNNGITIVCEKYSCPDNSQENKNSPQKNGNSDILLEKVQIVNGQQTIYSLFNAFLKDNRDFSKIKVLCKIFEVESKDVREEIAEYTNSQNSVKKRDIRSVDYRQKLLQKSLIDNYNILYERKKNEFLFKNNDGLKRIDAEIAGQLIMSFYLEDPTKAKNKKSSIFEDSNYYSIFNEEHDAEKIYVVSNLFDYIEENKKNIVRKLNKQLKNGEIDNKYYEKESYIKHCSLFLLFIVKKIINKEGLEINDKNIEKIKKKYFVAVNTIKDMIDDEFFDDKGENTKFLLYGPFFKNKTSLESFNKIFYKN